MFSPRPITRSVHPALYRLSRADSQFLTKRPAGFLSYTCVVIKFFSQSEGAYGFLLQAVRPESSYKNYSNFLSLGFI